MSIKDKQIDDIGLSTRSFNALYRKGIKTVEEMMELDEEKLYRIPQLGKKSVNEILLKIAQLKNQDSEPDDSEEGSFSHLIGMLSAKAYNLLSLNGCMQEEKILNMTLSDLLDIPFMDRTTADSIIQARNDYLIKTRVTNESGEQGDPSVFELIKIVSLPTLPLDISIISWILMLLLWLILLF